MNDPAETLLRRAGERFGALSHAERLMLTCTMQGTFAYCLDAGGGEDPQESARWPPSRRIRARLLRWLCVTDDLRSLLDPKGPQVIGAHFVEPVNLDFAEVAFPLSFYGCGLPDGLRLRSAKIPAVYMTGSDCGTVAANGVTVEHGMFLVNTSLGRVLLEDASIGATLDCSGARIRNPGAVAVDADGCRIEGTVRFSDDFRATGEVRLRGATVGRNIDCQNGAFDRPGGYALNASTVRVTGSVYLDDGCAATGTVTLTGATITGDLDCSAGRFKGPPHAVSGERDPATLDVERARIEGNVFLNKQFHLSGTARLRGTFVGRDVICTGADLGEGGGARLDLERAEIKGSLFWREVGLGPATRLILVHTTAAQLVDEKESWPGPGHIELDGFTYDAIASGPTDIRRLDWLRRASRSGDRFAPQRYTQLAKVLSAAGHEATARDILIAREQDRLSQSALSRGQRFWQQFLGVTIAYGYRPFRALGWAVVIVALGACLFLDGQRTGNIVPTDDEARKDSTYLATGVPPGGYPAFNALVYSMDVFLPIVNLHQVDHWLPEGRHGCVLGPDGTPCAWLYRTYFWLHIAAGWVLTTLFAAGLSGLVRRER